MKSKQEILADLQEGLTAGVLTKAEVQLFIDPTGQLKKEEHTAKPDKLSAVDIMFYIAGIVLFAALLSVITQSWNDGSALVHITLSAGIGAILWLLAYYLLKSPVQSETRKGLTSALLLTGSLLLIVGGYITLNEIIGGFNDVNFFAGAIALAVLGVVHFLFDKLIKRDIILLMGVLLGVAAFPAFLFGILQDANSSFDVWSVVLVLSTLLLAYATRVVAKISVARARIHNRLDSFAAFLGLLSMYISVFGAYSTLWMGALVVAVFGIFYLSIISQNKHLLGNASFFLVLSVITVSFKYFSGYGVTTSLILATIGLLGSAAVAASINKKYFPKQS